MPSEQISDKRTDGGAWKPDSTAPSRDLDTRPARTGSEPGPSPADVGDPTDPGPSDSLESQSTFRHAYSRDQATLIRRFRRIRNM